MNSDFLPTKRNLILAKRKLVLAKQGHDLLDKKYKVLMRELASIKKNASQLKKQLNDALRSALQCKVGDKLLEKIANKTPLDTGLQITYKSIMGALLPKLKNIGHASPQYSLAESSSSVDESFFEWQKVKMLLLKSAQTETSIRNITVQLQKAQKRAAALKNITIPVYEARIKYISEQLEERERDELARIKFHLKSKHTNAYVQNDGHQQDPP